MTNLIANSSVSKLTGTMSKACSIKNAKAAGKTTTSSGQLQSCIKAGYSTVIKDLWSEYKGEPISLDDTKIKALVSGATGVSADML